METIPSPKHPDQLQQPLSLLLNENHNFFSGSKVARADSLTTHICLAQSLKISAAIPPLNLSPSMAQYCDNFIVPLPPTYLQLSQVVTSFLSYKGSFLYIT